MKSPFDFSDRLLQLLFVPILVVMLRFYKKHLSAKKNYRCAYHQHHSDELSCSLHAIHTLQHDDFFTATVKIFARRYACMSLAKADGFSYGQLYTKSGLLAVALAGLTGCGGGGGGTSNNNTTQSPSQPTNPSSNQPTSTHIYKTLPNIANCEAGELSDTEKNLALSDLNAIRKQHGLQPVIYDSSSDHEVMQSALITVANAKSSHHPDKSSKCWTQAGYDGSGTSNLSTRWHSHNPNNTSFALADMSGWLIDDKVESLGHRRWLLDPFLTKIAYGRVDGKPLVNSKYAYVVGSSIKVIYNDKPVLNSTSPEFIAYPYQNYPKKWFKHDWYQSFSVIADTTTNFGKNKSVDFSKVNITVTESTGKKLAVTAIQSNHTGMGITNHLQWKTFGTKDNEKYRVTINNVIVNGQSRNYEYWFSIQ